MLEFKAKKVEGETRFAIGDYSSPSSPAISNVSSDSRTAKSSMRPTHDIASLQRFFSSFILELIRNLHTDSALLAYYSIDR